MARKSQLTVTVPWDLALFVQREARVRSVPKSQIVEEAISELRRKHEEALMREGYEEMARMGADEGY